MEQTQQTPVQEHQNTRSKTTSIFMGDHGSITTMTSREIAELCDKQHKNVKRDIEKMMTELGLDTLRFERIYTDNRSRVQTEYVLNKELTLTVVSGYSVILRHRVVVRLSELEQSVGVSRQEFDALKALIAEQTASLSKMKIELSKEIWASAIRATESLGAEFKQKPYTKGPRRDFKAPSAPKRVANGTDPRKEPFRVVGKDYEPSGDATPPWEE